MKNLFILLAFVFLPNLIFAMPGKIKYQDNDGLLTLNYDNQVNGKNSYKDASGFITVLYSGSRWEIYNNFTSPSTLLFYSNAQTEAKPPRRNVGNWQAVTATNLLRFNGSGTTTVLPVELVSFTAVQDNRSVNLNWITANETNNEGFQVEESYNGSEFRAIGSLKGSGNSMNRNEYSFTVKNPKHGMSYYRLKQMDFDGAFEYSKVISVLFEGNHLSIGEFYPNPSKSGMLNIEIPYEIREKVNVQVYNAIGKKVFENELFVDGQQSLSLDFSKFQYGTYIAKLGTYKSQVCRKFVISK